MRINTLDGGRVFVDVSRVISVNAKPSETLFGTTRAIDRVEITTSDSTFEFITLADSADMEILFAELDALHGSAIKDNTITREEFNKSVYNVVEIPVRTGGGDIITHVDLQITDRCGSMNIDELDKLATTLRDSIALKSKVEHAGQTNFEKDLFIKNFKQKDEAYIDLDMNNEEVAYIHSLGKSNLQAWGNYPKGVRGSKHV